MADPLRFVMQAQAVRRCPIKLSIQVNREHPIRGEYVRCGSVEGSKGAAGLDRRLPASGRRRQAIAHRGARGDDRWSDRVAFGDRDRSRIRVGDYPEQRIVLTPPPCSRFLLRFQNTPYRGRARIQAAAVQQALATVRRTPDAASPIASACPESSPPRGS